MSNTESFVVYLKEAPATAFPLVTRNNAMDDGEHVSL